MQNVSFEEVVERIVRKDPRFHPDSYEFLRQALDYTQQQLPGGVGSGGERSHVTGQQLLDGIRNFALREFGPMAQTVFSSWGVTRCEDFGEIVFNLIEHRFLRKRDTDTRGDFKAAYDFEQAFVHPFLPPSKRASRVVLPAARRSK
jgi:uncharacterized repeat protein (TIGR04138 family)